MPYYVNWTGSQWLAKEQSEFERQKAEDAGHPMRWWEEWRLLPEQPAKAKAARQTAMAAGVGNDAAAEALAAARAAWGDKGEQWGNPRAD